MSCRERCGRSGELTLQLLQRPEHQGERRAELVADIGKECSLGPVDFCQRLGAPAFSLVGTCLCDGSRDAARDQLEEAFVFLIQLTVRADADSDDARAMSLPC